MAAVTDYTTLKSYVVDLLDRSGDTAFAAQLDTFIGLAEAGWYPRLLNRQMETTADLTVTDGSASLPSDFHRVRAVYATINGERRVLQPITPRQEQILYPVDTGDPAYYKIVGSTFYSVPSGDFTATMDYYARFTGLSGSNATNWIITRHPHLYLDSVLAQAMRWTQEEDKAAKYEVSVERTLGIINSSLAMEYFNDSEMTLDSPTP